MYTVWIAVYHDRGKFADLRERLRIIPGVTVREFHRDYHFEEATADAHLAADYPDLVITSGRLKSSGPNGSYPIYYGYPNEWAQEHLIRRYNISPFSTPGFIARRVREWASQKPAVAA